MRLGVPSAVCVRLNVELGKHVATNRLYVFLFGLRDDGFHVQLVVCLLVVVAVTSCVLFELTTFSIGNNIETIEAIERSQG